jgi:hypothetical protein
LTTSNNGIDGAGVLEGLKLIDSDTHYSEPYDLWTSIIGADNVMWETDFPRPSCLHPDAVRRSAETLAALGPDVLRKVVQDNAANLYNIDLGDRAC